MRIPIRTAAAFLCPAMLGIGFATALAQTGERPDNIVWQVVTSAWDLNSVFFRDEGKHGWAVGNGGTILATQDGGEHWTLQKSPTPPNVSLHGVIFASDGRRGWAVGTGCTILSTTDGGGVWKATQPCDAALTGVAFSGRLGWVVGANGTILRTADGGEKWEPLPAGALPDAAAKSWFYGVASYGKDVWVVGANGMILHARDGGDKWDEPQETPTREANLRGVAFVDGRHGWAVGDKGTILFTEDGGEKWTEKRSPINENLSAVAFGTDKDSVWVVGDHGTILSTGDRGKNWKPPPTKPTDKALLGVALVESGLGRRKERYSHYDKGQR
jgi:photosystem II stability/assembly factor-like uncharacterized protein